MAGEEKNFLQQVIDGISSVDASAGELAKRVGWPLAVSIVLAVACGFLWWKWKEIKERPGVESLTNWLKRKPLPRAPADRIAMAQLANDKDREHETLLVDELAHFEGVETESVGRAKPRRKPEACLKKPAPTF